MRVYVSGFFLVVAPAGGDTCQFDRKSQQWQQDAK
jgi:hypothetical protein